MFQQQREKRKVPSILLVSIFFHGVILVLVLLQSIWNTDLHATPIKETATLFVPAPLPDEPIHISLTHRAQASGPKQGGGKPLSLATSSPFQPQTPLTQDNLVPADSLSPDTDPVSGSGDSISDSIGDGPGGPGAGRYAGEEPGPVHPGNGVEAPLLVHRVEPIYPEQARRMRIQGIVVMEAVIGLTGRVEEIRVLSSANPWLTQSALSAIQQWQYKPAKLRSKVVRCYLTVTVNFKLQ